ncbi:3-phenylpropionate MFS transporter [Photobacterium aphoticum]|uniref:MFS transporter n=3 Tax=Photobacterium aphoticum TaxID=754436 RepID=A0A0J1GMH1_9GAMM|nr:3-phenylpropionate MFS transporter [Photobacterium aphoticum]KLV00644.1 MFS transporter [Photobacterium aphoticum]GHA58801.1 3-phenylpropionic acid transporter [Photobacterium aphoticum]
MFRSSPYGWTSQYLLGFFFNYGVYLPFWALWLAHLGVSASHIGLLLGLGFGVRCLANLLITPRIHKVEHLIPALRVFGVAALISCIAYIYCGSNVWVLAIITVLYNMMMGPIVPLSDSLTNYYAKEGHLDYGRTRLWGSVAFIAGSTVVGLLAAKYDPNVIPWVAVVGLVAMLLFTLRAPTIVPVSEPESQTQGRPALLQMLRTPAVLRFLGIIALLQGSHAAYYSFSAIYWKGAGYSEDVIGYLWSFSVVAEVAVFALSQRLFAGWSVMAMFRLAAVGVMIRWGITASIMELPVLFAAQALHGVTFAAAHLATIRYIQQAQSNQMVALQALYNALPMGAFMALMTAVSGWLYGAWGGNVFWVMALMGLPALFMKIEPAGRATAASQPPVSDSVQEPAQ